ncbi:MAG: MATE family efflux transporter [Acutalibacteraceae bacterium]|nr:MATE family efflux transporter [Acutalibacteraceae bacterium]
MENLKENKMGHAPLLKLIISMSVPAMFSMIIQALYNIVDSIFVSHYSEAGLTAVSLAYPIQMLIIAVSVGTGVGVNSLVSRKLGEKSFEEANKAASHGLLLGFFNWLVFFILGLTIVKPFINAFTDDASLAQMGVDYLSVILIFSFGCFIEVVIEKILQATGNMIFPMLFMLTGAITNIILDPIFIFDSFIGIKGLGMGVKGAAVATVIAQIVSMIFAVIVLFAKKHDVQISIKNFRLSLTTIKNIYAVGIPAIIMQSITSLMLVMVNGIFTKFPNSDVPISVLNIYFKLQSFIFMPCFGLTQGLLPIMGYNYGARNKKRLTTALKYGCIIAGIIMTLGTIAFMTIPHILMGMFNANDEMMAVGCIALRTICLCFIPAAIGIVFSSFYQATGHGVRSMLMSLLRQLVLLVPSAYFLSDISMNAVWYAFPIAEAGSLIFAVCLFIHLYNKEIKHLSRTDN